MPAPTDRKPGLEGQGSPAWPRWAVRALPVIVVIGIALRLRELLADRSLWRDEASLVFNLRTRGVLGFTHPLDHDQATPPGFFVLAQTAGSWFGGSELVYRIVPFVASCLALAVGAVLARRHLRPVEGIVAVAILACSATLVAYGAEVKQYGVDLLFTLLVWWVADAAGRRGWSPRAVVGFGTVGVVALLCSYPAVFVLPVVGAAAVVAARSDRRAVLRLAAVGLVWAAVLAATYISWTRDLDDSAFLKDFWADGFLPLPPTSVAEVERWGGALGTLFTQLLSPRATGLAAAVAVLGAVAIALRRRPLLVILAGPLVLAIVASGLELYPLIERSAVFILPSVAVAMGAGVAAVGGLLARRDAVYRWAPAVIVVALAAAPAIDRAVAPPDQEELRPLLEGLAGQEQGATVVVTDTAEAAWLYYADRLDIHPERVLVREFPRQDDEAARGVVAEVVGHDEVWVVDMAFWRPEGALDPSLDRALDAAGRRIDARHAVGATVSRYDLSG